MARSRNIKPGFFQNEDLVDLDPIVRLLFIGLWTLADREGRLENRPKKIKMQLFPADELDVHRALTGLAEKRLITLYSIDNINYIQVDNFHKHQHPHMKEQKSTIPEPKSPVHAPDINHACPSDSLLPITDVRCTDSRLPLTDPLKPSTDKNTTSSSNNDGLFDAFWSAYPKKVGKKKCRVAFNRLSTKNKQAAISDAPYRFTNADPQYIPHPTTYIHGENWNDDQPIETQAQADKRFDDAIGMAMDNNIDPPTREEFFNKSKIIEGECRVIR